MTTYKNGAFVFSRARGLQPRTPSEISPIANRHGIDMSVIPPIPTDRVVIGRAIQHTTTRIAGETFLLRPIRRSSTEVTYGIVRENKNGDDHLDHDHESTVRWSRLNPAVIEGNHTIANRIRDSYAELRGKLVAEDFTSCVTAELERLGAVAMRDDGRVHWVPQVSLDEVRRLQGFLAEVGVTLILAEVESENAGVVTEVVAESVEEQLHKLEIEVQDFDSKQKPSMFARRLEEYQKLRQRALLYESALGIAASRATQVLSELETKVSAMLDIRQGMTVHKDGTVSKRGEKKVETPVVETPVSDPSAGTSLSFAGATFIQADCYDVGEMLFTSSDEHAISAVQSLESMGLAGKWQKAGNVEVVLANSGPPGAETSIRVRTGGGDLRDMAKALGSLGIEVAA